MSVSVAPPPPPIAVPEFTAVRVHGPIIEEDETETTAAKVTELEAENRLVYTIASFTLLLCTYNVSNRSLREQLSMANTASTGIKECATL